MASISEKSSGDVGQSRKSEIERLARRKGFPQNAATVLCMPWKCDCNQPE